MSVIVRRACPDDLPAIAELAGGLVRFHHALDALRYFLVDSVETGYARYFAGELNNPRAIILAAQSERGIVGYAYGRLEPRDWNALLDACGAIHDLFVHPNARREGAGKLLLSAMIEALEAEGAPRIVLYTAVQNHAAQTLFTMAGFRPTMLEMTRESARR